MLPNLSRDMRRSPGMDARAIPAVPLCQARNALVRWPRRPDASMPLCRERLLLRLVASTGKGGTRTEVKKATVSED